jgi:soluble epoxide hydrolase/lipid-phosphate phosphatase
MLVSFALLVQVAISSQLIASQPTATPNYNQSSITKQLTTLDGQTYVYDFVSAQNTSKPTLLLLHGYPSSRHDWDLQIATLAAEGFGVIAPDLLGFGDSSKPTAIEAYNTKIHSDHLAQILDAEGLSEVVGVGHDWGAGILGKMVAWYPERFSKIVIVSISYLPAGKLFDIDAANKQSLETLGYMQFGYWYFFNSWDAGDLISRNVRMHQLRSVLSTSRTDKMY